MKVSMNINGSDIWANAEAYGEVAIAGAKDALEQASTTFYYGIDGVKRTLSNVDQLTNIARLITYTLKMVERNAATPVVEGFYQVCQTLVDLTNCTKVVSRTEELTSGKAALEPQLWGHYNYLKVISRICLLINDCLHTIRVSVEWGLLSEKVGRLLTLGRSETELKTAIKGYGLLAWSLDLTVLGYDTVWGAGPTLERSCGMGSDVGKLISIAILPASSGVPLSPLVFWLASIAGTTSCILYLTKFLVKEYQLETPEFMRFWNYVPGLPQLPLRAQATSPDLVPPAGPVPATDPVSAANQGPAPVSAGIPAAPVAIVPSVEIG